MPFPTRGSKGRAGITPLGEATVFTFPLIAKARQRLIGLTIVSAAALATNCVLVPFDALAASPGDPIPLLASASLPQAESVPGTPAAERAMSPGSDSELGYRLSVSTPIVIR